MLCVEIHVVVVIIIKETESNKENKDAFYGAQPTV